MVTEIIRPGRAREPCHRRSSILWSRGGTASASLGFPKGVMIYRVRPNSPAAEAGLRRGDIILKANGDDISGITALNRSLSRLKVGDTLSLSILNRKPVEVQAQG